eukprot:3227165-Pyramimonas_sp.AAC.1
MQRWPDSWRARRRSPAKTWPGSNCTDGRALARCTTPRQSEWASLRPVATQVSVAAPRCSPDWAVWGRPGPTVPRSRARTSYGGSLDESKKTAAYVARFRSRKAN